MRSDISRPRSQKTAGLVRCVLGDRMGAHGVLVGRDRKKETATIRFDDDDAIVTVPMDFVAAAATCDKFHFCQPVRARTKDVPHDAVAAARRSAARVVGSLLPRRP